MSELLYKDNTTKSQACGTLEAGDYFHIPNDEEIYRVIYTGETVAVKRSDEKLFLIPATILVYKYERVH